MPQAVRLERGPAFSALSNLEPRPEDLEDWPTYRHDGARSGSTPASVTAELRPAWKQQLGGKLSSVVVAEGRVLVTQVDSHTVHALDSESGESIWSYTVGGRVDSPPTSWQGRTIFGCRDGWVYCLRSSDGELAWRFRAAPSDHRIVAYGQLESSWPVHGSALVQDGVVHCAAGRSSYLDGGIRLIQLDAKTGTLLSETLIDDRDPETGYQRKGSVEGTNMPGALPDILSSDGKSLFMRHRRFDLGGQEQQPTIPHLFSAAGFMDDSWWHRTYWMIGTSMTTDYLSWPQAGSNVSAGRLLVMDESFVYGFGRNQYIRHGAHVGIDGSTIFHFNPDRDKERRFTYYRVFCSPRELSADNEQSEDSGNDFGPSKIYRWNHQLPILARAMVLAKDTLFMAGPRDIQEGDDPNSTLQGRQGGVLLALGAADGAQLSEFSLDSPPVFDGLVAAGGSVYMSTIDGHVIRYSAR